MAFFAAFLSNNHQHVEVRWATMKQHCRYLISLNEGGLKGIYNRDKLDI